MPLSAAVGRDAPLSGAPFLASEPLGRLIAENADQKNDDIIVSRLRPNLLESGSANACDLGDQASKSQCMQVAGPGCMWTRIESKDPTLPVQASNSYCLPCEIDGEEIPCWNVGAWVGGKQVTECQMSCNHQKRIFQQGYACSDGNLGITQSQCFERGTSSGSNCMYISYEDKAGTTNGFCGACEMQGSGSWGCPMLGSPGPVDGSTVTSCLSQCDKPCAGPPDCAPTMMPPPPPPPPSPGLTKVDAPGDAMLSAPMAGGSPPINPRAIVQAALDAAKAAGMPITTAAPLPVYFPVLVYRVHQDATATTIPPYGVFVPPTAPPAEKAGAELPASAWETVLAGAQKAASSAASSAASMFLQREPQVTEETQQEQESARPFRLFRKRRR